MTAPTLSMHKADYGIYRRTDAPYDEAVARVRAELEKEGFGIITEIDARATFKKKLDVDFPSYVILGACAPKIAHDALRAQPDVGLLLPCNVVVHDAGEGTEISAIKPTILFERLVKNDRISEIARDIETRLERALDRSVA